jgi:hypothetical protein
MSVWNLEWPPAEIRIASPKSFMSAARVSANKLWELSRVRMRDSEHHLATEYRAPLIYVHCAENFHKQYRSSTAQLSIHNF